MNYLNTCTYHDKGDTVTRLYSTEIVRVNNTQIKLNTGGWNTVTTKRRMNQVSQDNALGFNVFQRVSTCFNAIGNGSPLTKAPTMPLI